MSKLFVIFFFLLGVFNAFSMTTVTVRKAGTLGSLLTQAQQDTCTSLAIKGKLNSADIRVLRRMAGYGADGRGGRVETLDLREVRFIGDKEPFMILDAAECRLSGTAVPDRYIANNFSPPFRNGLK